MIRLRCSVIAADRADVVDVEVTGPVGCTLRDVRRQLEEIAGLPTNARLHVGGREVEPDARWGLPPLVNGCVLADGRRDPGHRPGALPDPGVLVVDVVGGPDAGRRYPVRPGQHVVGRAASAAVCIRDPAISRHHAVLAVTPAGLRISDLGSANGTEVEGTRIPPAGSTLHPGQRVRAGRSTLVVREPGTRPAATRPTGDGALEIRRPPRRVPPCEPVVVRRPRPPQPPARQRFPWLAVVLPLVVAVPVATVAHQPMFLLFAVLSPVLAAGHAVADRCGRRRDHRDAVRAWRVADRRATTALAQATRAELRRLREAVGDPAELMDVVETPSVRLWERTPDAPDLLELAVGTGRAASSIRHGDRGEETTQWLQDAPVVVRMIDCGHVGLSGPRDRMVSVARWLVGQVLARHGPGTVQVAVLAGRSPGPAWRWLRWVPHRRCMTSADVEAEVARRSDRHDRPAAGPPPGPTGDARLLVVMDDRGPTERLRRTLREGPRLGVHLLWLAESPDALPDGCGAELHLHGTGAATLRTSDGRATEVVVDGVSDGWAWRLARALAALREAGPDQGATGLPASVALLDLHEVDLLSSRAVAEAWSREGRSTRVPVGVSPGGPFCIDLRRDGPHALIGGTTGSGKSELLRTLVTSLAARNRPDELTFVLVDYKGGAAFAGCSELPHVLGVITDLDAQLAARALTSLQAELVRRERCLGDLGARDLEEHQQRPRPPGSTGLPRLVLVIDEFGVLARELPDFLDGVVRLAAVGRSLGIHLVLATQRPSGVVSADIQANVNLRIALRLRDRSDSQDVLEAPDAAHLPQGFPGRALVRTGSGGLTTFQVATVGIRGTRHAAERPQVRLVEWDRPASVPQRHAPPGTEPDDVLSEITAAARQATRSLGIRIPPSPWLPPLPDTIAARDLDGTPEAVPLGVLDLPHLQAQPTLLWDPVRDGHLGVVGGQGSGRTTALTTLAVGLARSRPPDRLQLHAIDVGGSLHGLRPLPHLGTLTGHDRPALVARLLVRLAEQLADRQRRQPTDHGATLEQESGAGRRPSGRSGGIADPPAPVVLIIDGWEAVVTALEAIDHGRAVDDLLALARDGSSAGLRVALSGGRDLLLGRVSALLAERLVLRTGDPTDLVLAGVPADAVPAHQPPGRAIRASDGAHVQLAVPGDTATPGALGAAVEQVRARWGGHGPADLPRLRPLPTSVRTDELPVRPDVGTAARRHAWLGLGGDEAAPCGLDLDADPIAVVCGPSGSGRTTALRTIATSLAAAGTSVVTVSPRVDGELAGPWACCRCDAFQTLTDLVEADPRTCVLVDDVELAVESGVEPVLVELARRRGPTALIVAGDTASLLNAFRGVIPMVRSARTGVVLQPARPGDGEVLGVRVQPPDERAPGRGVLVVRGRQQPVQVAR